MTINLECLSIASHKYLSSAVERFANAETGTGFTLARETVRDPSYRSAAATPFAFLTQDDRLNRYYRKVTCRTPHTSTAAHSRRLLSPGPGSMELRSGRRAGW